MNLVKVDLRTLSIIPGYLVDIASEYAGRELIATTEDEYTTEFAFESGSAAEDAANAAGFRRALRSFLRNSTPTDTDPDAAAPVDGGDSGPL